MHTQAAMHKQSSAGRHEHVARFSSTKQVQAATAKEDHTSSTSHEV